MELITVISMLFAPTYRESIFAPAVSASPAMESHARVKTILRLII